MKRSPFDVFEALQRSAWPILLAKFRPDCCIAATGIGLSVLQRFGIAGVPTVTAPVVMNAAFRGWDEGGRVGDPPADARYVVTRDENEPEPTDGKRFAAHLVITGKVKGEHYLLDLSAPQFDRPAKRIHVLVPNVARLAAPLGHDGKGIAADLPEGGLFVYFLHPKPPAYEISPDWTLSRPWAPAMFAEVRANLIQAVEAHLARPQPNEENEG
jgi:hypothetical protein